MDITFAFPSEDHTELLPVFRHVPKSAITPAANITVVVNIAIVKTPIAIDVGQMYPVLWQPFVLFPQTSSHECWIKNSWAGRCVDSCVCVSILGYTEEVVQTIT